jgi:dihydrofolate synthase/folylpolyglutamate synthase
MVLQNGQAAASIHAIHAAIDDILGKFTHFGVELGLERIQRLLIALGNPHQTIPILHVAGSNGKGSVCAYLSAVLTEAGYRVGRYTSPHLVNWCERICINEQAIAPADLHQVLLQVLTAISPDHPSPTQFEVITAAAWLYFAQQRVDIAVIEVGLGGRLDATNVCDRPLVSIITSLSREHWQRLGPTLANIAREKAGILKPNCPAVVGPLPLEAEEVIKQRIVDLNCPALWVKPSHDLGNGWAEYQGLAFPPPVSNLPLTQSGLATWPSAPFSYPLVLPGAHQLTNSALAIATLQLLQELGWATHTETIVQGIAKTRWPARLQWTTWQNRPLLIDGAHNPAGAAALRQYIDNMPAIIQPVTWVMGMLSTKDHADIFQELLRPGDRLYLVPVPDHLSADMSQLASLAQSICPQLATCQICTDLNEGLQSAAQVDVDPVPTTILCGSLYLIGYFFKLTET